MTSGRIGFFYWSPGCKFFLAILLTTAAKFQCSFNSFVVHLPAFMFFFSDVHPDKFPPCCDNTGCSRWQAVFRGVERAAVCRREGRLGLCQRSAGLQSRNSSRRGRTRAIDCSMLLLGRLAGSGSSFYRSGAEFRTCRRPPRPRREPTPTPPDQTPSPTPDSSPSPDPSPSTAGRPS